MPRWGSASERLMPVPAHAFICKSIPRSSLHWHFCLKGQARNGQPWAKNLECRLSQLSELTCLRKLLMLLSLTFRKQLWLHIFHFTRSEFLQEKWRTKCNTIANLLISIGLTLLNLVDLGRWGKRYLGYGVPARLFSLSSNGIGFTCSNSQHNCTTLL